MVIGYQLLGIRKTQGIYFTAENAEITELYYFVFLRALVGLPVLQGLAVLYCIEVRISQPGEADVSRNVCRIPDDSNLVNAPDKLMG